MPSDDLLSPDMFQCTLDETGVDGYRPTALRLLEAHDAALREQVRTLRAALADMASGWDYIRTTHGDLYGVGWDRCDIAARAALAATEPEEKP